MLPRGGEKSLDLDKFIILEIIKCSCSKKEANTWEMAKKYNWDLFEKYQGKVRDTRFYNKMNQIIKKRLFCMAKEGFVKIQKDEKGWLSYLLLGERVNKKQFKVNHGKICAIQIILNSGKKAIFEI